MKTDLPTYPAYRATGVAWLGNLPTHWETRQLGFISDRVSVGLVINPSSYVSDEGVPFLLGGDIREFKIDISNCNYCPRELSNGLLQKSRLSDGDLVVVRVGYPGVAAVVPPELEGSNCASMMIVRCHERFCSQWLAYVFNSQIGRDQVGIVQYGAAQKQFNIGHAVKFKFPFPPKTEQEAIASFLDRETAKLDRLIAVRRKQVERLQEQRVAAIDHAVIKGLHSDTKTKPSGHPWLEEIPAHWTAIRLKFISKVNPGKAGSGYNAFDKDDVVFLPMECVGTDGQVDQSNRQRICDLWKGFTYFARGDVLVAKITPCFENGKGALVSNLETEIGFGTTEFHVLRAGGRLLGSFLFLVTASSRFRGIGERFMTGAAGQQRVSEQFISNFPIALPPLEEQHAIVEHIKLETEKMDKLIAKYGRELDLLAEYRASLISHAVTGKIDVRNLAHPIHSEEIEAA